MQGANDNYSGDAAILETARTIKSLVADGRLPRPRRTIRFLWAPEISGTGAWVKANPDVMRRTLCDINLDMVGVDLAKSMAFFCFMRTTYGNPHYVNDVVENAFRYVGETNRSYVTNGMTGQLNRRIVAPSGSEQPMPWYAGTHFGSSDHEVFNDWGVGVPGVVLNTWPDQWYHTSEDRPDKLDATQMKRAVAVTAAAAYIIASADDKMAGQIAAEIVSNASGRIGHQIARGVEEMKRATAETLPRFSRRCGPTSKRSGSTNGQPSTRSVSSSRINPASPPISTDKRRLWPKSSGPGSKSSIMRCGWPSASPGSQRSSSSHRTLKKRPRRSSRNRRPRSRRAVPGLPGAHPAGPERIEPEAGAGRRAGNKARRPDAGARRTSRGGRDPSALRRPELRPGHQEAPRHRVRPRDEPRNHPLPARDLEESGLGRILTGIAQRSQVGTPRVAAEGAPGFPGIIPAALGPRLRQRTVFSPETGSSFSMFAYGPTLRLAFHRIFWSRAQTFSRPPSGGSPRSSGRGAGIFSCQGTSLRLATRPWALSTGEYGGSRPPVKPGAPAAVARSALAPQPASVHSLSSLSAGERIASKRTTQRRGPALRLCRQYPRANIADSTGDPSE